MNYDDAQNGLLKRRSELTAAIRDEESKLLAIKNLVRTSGLMPNEKYKQCCDSQAKHVRKINVFQKEAALVKDQLRELSKARDAERYNKIKADGVELLDAKSIVTSLAALREHYQSFAADLTRVSSMRQMASEFVLKLNPIIRNLINSPTQQD